MLDHILVSAEMYAGGGRGMRVIREGDSVEDAITTATSEALAAFGSDDVFLERWVNLCYYNHKELISRRDSCFDPSISKSK